MRIEIWQGPTRKDLDILLNSIPSPQIALWRRMDWMRDLCNWVFSESPLKGTELKFETGLPQARRIKWLLHVLDRNPAWRSKFQGLLRSVIRETRIFEALVSMGLHQQSGLVSEFAERIQRRVLPRPPEDQNIEVLMSQAFDEESDAIAISRVDPATFQKLSNLVLEDDPSVMDSWKEDLFTSCSHLALQIAALGSQQSLRERNSDQSKGPTAFVRLQLLTLEWLQTSSDDTRKTLYNEVTMTAEECLSSLRSVYDHMDEHGVSIDLVYHLERTKALITRFLSVFKLFEHNTIQLDAVQNLMALLIYDSVHGNSIRALIDDNTALIAKKIAENSAETGEHYIAQTAIEEAALFRSALGGGALTAVTTIFKFLIAAIPSSPFFHGFFASVNYSVSFLAIHFQGFSLATKQPAMTAATLANQIQSFDNPVDQANHEPSETALQPIVNEILAVFRSQSLAVVGNILAVIPGVFLLCGTFGLISGSPFLTIAKAEKTLNSFSLLGPTPFYAAFTGVLLFTSSLISGWFYHWVMFRRLPQGMARSSTMTTLLGHERARKFSYWFRKNSAALAANISLGFLLGLSPVIFEFVGLPLDVRHVTLSTGSLVAAVMTLGYHILGEIDFWLAVGGIFSMAVLNLTVSFALALAVALRSKRISFRSGVQLIKTFLRQLVRNPGLLFQPRGNGSGAKHH